MFVHFFISIACNATTHKHINRGQVTNDFHLFLTFLCHLSVLSPTNYLHVHLHLLKLNNKL